MKYVARATSSLGAVAIVIFLLFMINSCIDRNHELKKLCIEKGGSVVETGRDTMCFRGTVEKM